MPTPGHDSPAGWFIQTLRRWERNRSLTLNESNCIYFNVGTDIKFTQGPYQGACKQPDGCFIPIDLTGAFRNWSGQLEYMPTMAIECGWSESYPELQDDANRLLIGGNGNIRVVFLVVWNFQVSGVACRIEKWSLDRAGMPRIKQPVQIVFPAPDPPVPQHFTVTFKDLWGANLAHFPDRLATNQHVFDVSEFRIIAENTLVAKGLYPA
ncbi:hypothetical protein N7495_007117 [Penicillium taxi]|uniref:uncharacterized protein n=1 Tax=Penicillium taxi TaxID=168475 RepID=UPI0025454B2B|nr:uncharacterized protein N7495_007117 [Penicillium taxi]KAJ5895426.1 hypothetical protein N7495_007117 [Penicillium taxi]